MLDNLSAMRLSWRAIILIGAASLLPAAASRAQSLDSGTIAKIAATTRSVCLSGGQYDLQANADGSLSLLKLEPGGQAKIRITQSTGTGGALNYQDEGKRVEADKHIINCINQNLPLLLTAAGARLAPPAPTSAEIEQVTWARAKAQYAAARGREMRDNAVQAQLTAAAAQQRAIAAQHQAASYGNANGYIYSSSPGGWWYQGQFNDGRRNGYGVAAWPTEYYEGEWRNDQRDGFGVNISVVSGQHQEGLWRNNHLSQGIIIFSRQAPNPYEGEWDGSSDYHGYGVVTFNNGTSYEGELRDFTADGYGVLFYRSGDRYEGMSHKGRPDGWGYMVRSSGTEERGFYNDGRLVIPAAEVRQ